MEEQVIMSLKRYNDMRNELDELNAELGDTQRYYEETFQENKKHLETIEDLKEENNRLRVLLQGQKDLNDVTVSWTNCSGKPGRMAIDEGNKIGPGSVIYFDSEEPAVGEDPGLDIAPNWMKPGSEKFRDD